MALPGFRKRRSVGKTPDAGVKDGPLSDDQAQLKRATRTRKHAIIFTTICYLIAVVFLILVEIGSTKASSRVLGDIFFFKLDLSDIMASSVSGLSLSLTNSIARTLGLHDFYQVGLWNFCEGYEDEGITHCSTPTSLYWFNPVEILQSELLAGATIALPSEVNTILNILRIASQVMFGFFIAGLVLDVALMLLAPVVLYSRWWSFPFAIFAFIAALMVIAAAAVATAISLVFQYALTSQVDLNIRVDIGTKMWAFMWIGAGFTFLAFLVHAGLGCYCTSRRDVRTGRKKGRHLTTVSGTGSEKPNKGHALPTFGRTPTTSD